MTKQLIAVCFALIPGAVWTTYMGTQPHPRRNEEWLKSRVPTELAGYRFLSSPTDPKVSYKMDETTYNELEPLGIAAQVYEDPKGARYEVVVIAGDRMANFHDQRVCFVMQGWNLQKNEPSQLNGTKYGSIPIMDLKVAKVGQGSRPALFVWRSPRQFTIDRRVAKSDFLVDGLLGRPNMIGFSYRFMGASEDATSEGLTTFAANYFNALEEIESKSKD